MYYVVFAYSHWPITRQNKSHSDGEPFSSEITGLMLDEMT